jgi:hypothetical protein
MLPVRIPIFAAAVLSRARPVVVRQSFANLDPGSSVLGYLRQRACLRPLLNLFVELLWTSKGKGVSGCEGHLGSKTRYGLL